MCKKALCWDKITTTTTTATAATAAEEFDY
jgi:hypothetical protein